VFVLKIGNLEKKRVIKVFEGLPKFLRVWFEGQAKKIA
jgi:hypothetical protein